MDAPERIWAEHFSTTHPAHGWEGHWHIDEAAFGGTEYVRADIAWNEALEAALKVAAEWEETLEKNGFDDSAQWGAAKIFEDIRALKK